MLRRNPSSAGRWRWSKTGDLIELDVPSRKLNLHGRAKKNWRAAAPRGKRRHRKFERGYGAIFSKHITQANEGCDFDFLEGTAPTAEPEIH